MAYVKNSKLYDSLSNVLLEIQEEVLMAPVEYDGYFAGEYTLPSSSTIFRAITSYYNIPLFKVMSINEDESDNKDISEYIMQDSISHSQNLQNGQRGSLSFDLDNTSGTFYPSPISTCIWFGRKVRLYCGLLCDGVVYWFPKGIYIITDIGFRDDDNSNTISIQSNDKFCKLDGTISGKLESDYEVPNGSFIYDVVKSLLVLDSGNGDVYDPKTLIFDEKYKSYKTPYTIKKASGTTIGDVILELCEIISCDVYYNEDGHLLVEAGDELLSVSNKSILWHYNEYGLDMSTPEFTYDFSSVVNKITVVGAVVNGKIFKYTAENTNPASPTNTGFSPVKHEIINDDNLYSDDLCEQRAKYELQKKSVLPLQLKFTSVYIPFLITGELFAWTCLKHNFVYDKFLISSIQMKGDGSLSISATNANELPFN